jgi:AcrR family transcriptional regulator
MLTLRQRQKRKREKGILDAAEKLITSKGYINTSIEEIADKAEVGVGTVYNYFQSKPKLLMALFYRYHLALMESGNAILNNPPENAIDALCALLRVYFEGPVMLFHKDHIREIFSVISNERLSIRKESMQHDYMLLEQVIKLIETLQSRNLINRDIPPHDLSMCIYSIFMMAGMIFIYDDDTTIDSTMEFIRHNIEIIYDGFKP